MFIKMLIIRFFNMVLIQGCASWLHSVQTLLLVGGKAKISLALKKANVGFHGSLGVAGSLP